MIDAHTTDWAALGLPDQCGQNAFTSVPPRGKDKPYNGPKKRGPRLALPKTVQATMALETPQERALRKALRPRSPTFNVPIATAADNAKTPGYCWAAYGCTQPMTTDLIKSVSFEALLMRRDGMLQRLEQARALCLEANTMAEGLCTVAWALTGTTYNRELCLTDDRAMETAQKRIDAAGWKFLMEESGLKSFMDTKARDEWDQKVHKCDVPPLTIGNIESTFRGLYGARSDMFERGVINVFKSLSWHYKTNLPQKFGKRIVLNYLGQPGLSMDRRRHDEIDDLGRVLHVLDNKPEADHRHGYGQAVDGALRARQSVYDCQYFSLRMFKKGSGHMTFKRLDLVDQMNGIIAKHFPDALPEPRSAA